MKVGPESCILTLLVVDASIDSVQVVWVECLCHISCLVVKLPADRVWILRRVDHWIKGAILRCVVRIQVFWNHIKAKECVKPARISVIPPVRGTVPNHEATNFVHLYGCVVCRHLCLQIRLIKLPSQIRHINAAIAFSGDVDVMLAQAIKLGEKVLQRYYVVNRCAIVVVFPRLIITGDRVTDTCGHFDEQHIGPSVPRVRIGIDG